MTKRHLVVEDDDDDFEASLPKSISKVKSTTEPKGKKKRRLEKKVVDDMVETKVEFVVPPSKRFQTRVQVEVNLSIIDELKSKLTPRQLELFRKTCFGHFLDMPSFDAKEQLVLSVLFRELRQHGIPKEMLFCFNGVNVKFGLREFELITGLKCEGEVRMNKKLKLTDSKLYNDYFSSGSCQKLNLKKCFTSQNWKSDVDAVKIAVLYFMYTFLFYFSETKSLDPYHFYLVDSGEFNNYPWGKVVFDSTVRSLTHRLDVKRGYYRSRGFGYALQIFYYECNKNILPCGRLKHKFPRVLRWDLDAPHEWVDSSDDVFEQLTPLDGERDHLKQLFDSFMNFNINEFVECGEPSDKGKDVEGLSVDHKIDRLCNDLGSLKEDVSLLRFNVERDISSLKRDLQSVEAAVITGFAKLENLINDFQKKKMSSSPENIPGSSKATEDLERGKNVFEGFSVEKNSAPDEEVAGCSKVDANLEVEKSEDTMSKNQLLDDLTLSMEEGIHILTSDLQKDKVPDCVDSDAAGDAGASGRDDAASSGDAAANFDDDFVSSSMEADIHALTSGFNKEDPEKSKEKLLMVVPFSPPTDDGDTLVVPRVSRRTKKPSQQLKSPYDSRRLKSTKSSTTNVVLDDHPFKSSVTEAIDFKLICDFSDWVEKGLRPRNKKILFSKEDNNLNPPFAFEKYKISKRLWFFDLKSEGKFLDSMHINILFYYLRKKASYCDNILGKITTMDDSFDFNIRSYYSSLFECDESDGELPSKEKEKEKKRRERQLLQLKDTIFKHINGSALRCGKSWVDVDDVLLPVNVNQHWLLLKLSFADRCVYAFDSMSGGTHKANVKKALDIHCTILPQLLCEFGFWEQRPDLPDTSAPLNAPFKLIQLKKLPIQQTSDCGAFCSAFAEYLIEGKAIPPGDIDIGGLRIRYAALLWQYGQKKIDKNLTSEDEASTSKKKKK